MMNSNFATVRLALIRKIRESLADLIDKLPDEPLCEFRGNSGADSAGLIVAHSQNSWDTVRKNNAIQTIEECLRAIEKIDEGTYGECDECEEEIIRERLQLYPYSVLCTKCKGEIEKISRQKNDITTDSGPRSSVNYVGRKISELMPRINALAA